MLQELNAWVEAQGLPAGEFLHELADPVSGDAVAVLDLAWREGLQPGLSEPVALLVDEGPELLACANRYGFRCFTDIAAFERYVARDVTAEERSDAA